MGASVPSGRRLDELRSDQPHQRRLRSYPGGGRPLSGQAVPLAGSWFGKAEDYLGMSVDVAVRKLGDVADQSEE